MKNLKLLTTQLRKEVLLSRTTLFVTIFICFLGLSHDVSAQVTGSDLTGSYSFTGSIRGDITMKIDMDNNTSGKGEFTIPDRNGGVRTLNVAIAVTNVDGPIIYFTFESHGMGFFNTSTGKGSWTGPVSGRSGTITRSN